MSESILQIAKKQLKAAFLYFDTDRSGFIEKHQLGAILKRLTDKFNVQDPSDQDVNEILKELDINGDGKISHTQFQALVQQVAKIIEEQKKSQQAF